MSTIPLNTQFIGLAATVDTTERRSALINAESAAYTMQDIVDTTRPYKVYTALLTQSGTNAPVATVLQNTLSGTITWSYSSVGNYQGTLVGAFPSSKTFFYINSEASYNNGPNTYNQKIRQLTRISDDIVFLSQTELNFTAGVFSSAGGANNFQNASIEIRVYP
jgi:hypothetical protein